MLELFIIRHGYAGTSLEDEEKDQKRPLKKKGKDQMKEVAKGLKDLKIGFDIILTSPLARAKQTAEIVHEYCGNSKQIMETHHLLPDSSFSELSNFLNKLKNKPKKVAIVGHEPFLSGYAAYCLSKSKNPFIHLKKGGILKLEVEKTIKPEQCKLSWLLEPKIFEN